MTTRRLARSSASAGAVLAMAGVAFVSSPGRPATRAAREATATRATFVETLVESGTVTAARMMLYGAPVGALPAKIIELAPEGQHVSPGDVIVRLDTSALQQVLLRDQAALDRAESDVAQARAEAGAEQRAGRVQVMEAEAALAEAERDVRRAVSNVDDLRPLLEEGFITRAELERAEQALARAEEQRRIAAARLDLRGAGRAEAPAELSRSRAALDAALSRAAELRSQVATLRRHIELSTIRAERPGLVVYRELFFGSERRKPQVGDEALPNQPLVAVPDASELTVETRVREIDLHRVAMGQPVAVRFDAFPGLRLAGRVEVVGALGQEDAARAGTKYFPVSVRLEQLDPRLRTGMTAQIEIETASIPHATVIPLEAVAEDDGGAYCLVVRGDRTERRPVIVWGRNATTAAIKSGLTAGERLRLPDGP
jgi:multidrug resistance efflux pump